MGSRSAPVSFADLIVDDAQIGSQTSGHFALNDQFYRQQLAIPTQLDKLPGGAPSFGQQFVANKSLPDSGPSEAMADEWDAAAIANQPTGEGRLNVERFFDPETHTNDAAYAFANSYMPPPAVHHYGLANEEYYPIWGMNDSAVRSLSKYPSDTSTWSLDGQAMVQNTSSALENQKRAAFNPTAPIGSNEKDGDTRVGALHSQAPRAQAPGATLPDTQDTTTADLSHLPGGKQADKISMSYHDVHGIQESPYAYKDDELVHSSILDIRLGYDARADNLATPRVPFTTAGHDEVALSMS